MNQTAVLLAVLCIALCLDVQAAEQPENLTVLSQDSGMNLSDMNLTLYSATTDFGISGISIGEAVRFTAPRSGWRLLGVQVLGWSGFNNTTQTFPADRNFLLEIRDSDLNLLYKFADAQNMYFLSTEGPVFGGIEIPAVEVTGDFYVVFYDRGGMGIAREEMAGTGASYFFIGSRMVPAEFRDTVTNETMKVNWMIRAVGR